MRRRLKSYAGKRLSLRRHKGLNLRNAKDLIIATGIFVAIVGVAFLLPRRSPEH